MNFTNLQYWRFFHHAVPIQCMHNLVRNKNRKSFLLFGILPLKDLSFVEKRKNRQIFGNSSRKWSNLNVGNQLVTELLLYLEVLNLIIFKIFKVCSLIFGKPKAE